jgi:RND family efflux transporter MFP subunit
MKRTKKSQGKIIIGLICALFAGLILYTIINRMMKKEEVDGEVLTPVIAALPERGSISRKLYYSGTLMPKNTVMIISKVSGKIEKIFVKKGDVVTQDQTLVKIEDNAVSLRKEQAYSFLKVAEAQYEKAKKGLREEEIENARALVAQAEEDMALAEENFERTKNLFKSGTISKSTYDEAENMVRAGRTSLENAKRTLMLMEQGASDEEIEMAKANAEAARAQFELAKLQVDFTELSTPGFGIVADILADEGNLVGTSTPIMTIVQINPILAKIPVPEQYYGEFLENKETISIDIFPIAYPDSGGFNGDITAISPVIDPMSRTFEVEIEISNPIRKLRPGMYVNVEITLEVHDHALLLPSTAVVTRDNKKVIFIIEENSPVTVVRHEIMTGISTTDTVEILSNIPEGRQVIIEGNLFIEHGQSVQVIQRSKEEG